MYYLPFSCKLEKVEGGGGVGRRAWEGELEKGGLRKVTWEGEHG